ncbi:MAG TPA: beta-galactosidase, partial [Puia sp.]|nr:beta-galactosidase [Puia sp.]
MRHVYSLLLGCLFAVSVCAQQPNDHIFPAAAAARASISFDKNGFFVDGKRTFLVSAGMEYARVPRALWADRLLRLQRCGFNCVEVYTFWNIHEPREGVFDFKGENDLDAFLKLVKKMGMYAIVRVGPYYCAEWDNGGYPLWLKFKPGLRVREPNFLFEKYVGLFFDRLLPIVSANQIHRGGAVIMVQLENEHPAGWGTDEPNSYFSFLRKKALTLGLEVPYFFSGLHHDNDPAGETLSLRDPARPNPWFSTEFWSVWYNGYGSGDSAARVFGRRTWKIIARGGGGYNYYMAHGGSNFGYTNNDEDAASYDYGAAVGQAGDLRPIYYAFKRAAFFARSFASELCLPNAIGFLDSAGEIMPVVHDCALTGTVRLVGNTMPVLGKLGTTLMVYGKAGNEGILNFLNKGKRIDLRVVMPLSGAPVSYMIGQVRVLVMNTEMADRCWIVGNRIIVGPRYVGKVEVKEGHLLLETEDTVGAVVYTATGSMRLAAPAG